MIFYYIFILYFISLTKGSITPVTGVTVFCGAERHCYQVGNKKCVRLQGRGYCVAPCDLENEIDQCGGVGKCKEVNDVHQKPAMICTDRMTCMDDNACHSVNPKKPKCNLHTLTCIADPITTTTTTSTSTTLVTTIKITTSKSTRIFQSKTSNNFITTTRRRIIIYHTTKPCSNHVDGGNFDCLAHISYCHNHHWSSIMKHRCPKTCQFCDTSNYQRQHFSSCSDHFSDCSNKKHLCKKRSFKKFMFQYCPLTCHHC